MGSVDGKHPPVREPERKDDGSGSSFLRFLGFMAKEGTVDLENKGSL